MTNYILIDAKTRAPVPLPFDTTLDNEPFRVDGYSEPDDRAPNGKVVMRTKVWPGFRYRDPSLLGLALITEEEFMAERQEPECWSGCDDPQCPYIHEYLPKGLR